MEGGFFLDFFAIEKLKVKQKFATLIDGILVCYNIFNEQKDLIAD